MIPPRDAAMDLLRRLLAGERGEVPMQLALVLEKSSALHNSDDHYRQALPPELADLWLSAEDAEQIVAMLCAEVSRDPDGALILALSFSGAEQAIKVVSKMLTEPPRPLTAVEYRHAMPVMSAFLPSYLTKDPGFLPEVELNRLIQLAKNLKNVELEATDKAAQIKIRLHASQLLERLGQLGIEGV